MAITSGDILGGFGAAIRGTSQQYSQGIRQREQQMTQQKREELQARQIAMYQDAGSAYQLLLDGDLPGIVRLTEDRLQMLDTFPDADPSDTMRIRENAMSAISGDPNALRQLALELTGARSTGMALGILKPQEQERGVVVGNSVVDPSTGDVIYAAPPPRETAFDSSPGITRYRNGIVVQYSRDGKRQVLDDLGNVVTGEAARAAIQSGIDSGVVEAGQIAAEQVQGRGLSERAQSIINTGIDAIGQFPTLINAIGLLDGIKTGGLAAANIRAKSLFGIESGDEGELSYLLSTNVLQQLRPIFGASFTASEGERLASISASISRSPETNRRLLNEAMRIARTAAEKALDRADEAGDTSTVREIQNALRQLDEFESGSQNTMQQNIPQSAVNAGVTPDEWNRMTPEQKGAFP